MSNQLISLADVLRLCDRYENESWYSPSEFVLDLRKLAQNNPSPQLSDMENQKGDDKQSPDRKLAYNPVDTYNSSPRENVKEQRDNNINCGAPCGITARSLNWIPRLNGWARLRIGLRGARNSNMKITLEDRAMTTPEEVIEKNIMRRIMKSGSAYTATIVPSMNFSIYAHRRVFPTSTCRKSSIASVQRCIHDHEPQDR